MDLNLNLYVWFCVVFACVLGSEEWENHCDPVFKSNVEHCLERLRGFPVMARNKTLIPPENWDNTDIICKRGLVRSASVCVREVYARCPKTQAMRSLCGFQGVHPDYLLTYGEAVCKHRDVLKRHGECLKDRHCRLQSCLNNYKPAMSSALIVGMWKFSTYSPHCSYHAYVQHCHERMGAAPCHGVVYLAQLDLLKASRPSYCSLEDTDHLKRLYLLSEAYAIGSNGAASNRWPSDTCRYVSESLIGVLVAVFVSVWMDVL